MGKKNPQSFPNLNTIPNFVNKFTSHLLACYHPLNVHRFPGFTALHETAAHGFHEAATLLLANGRAPTNMRDARGAESAGKMYTQMLNGTGLLIPIFG